MWALVRSGACFWHLDENGCVSRFSTLFVTSVKDAESRLYIWGMCGNAGTPPYRSRITCVGSDCCTPKKETVAPAYQSSPSSSPPSHANMSIAPVPSSLPPVLPSPKKKSHAPWMTDSSPTVPPAPPRSSVPPLRDVGARGDGSGVMSPRTDTTTGFFVGDSCTRGGDGPVTSASGITGIEGPRSDTTTGGGGGACGAAAAAALSAPGSSLSSPAEEEDRRRRSTATAPGRDAAAPRRLPPPREGLGFGLLLLARAPGVGVLRRLEDTRRKIPRAGVAPTLRRSWDKRVSGTVLVGTNLRGLDSPPAAAAVPAPPRRSPAGRPRTARAARWPRRGGTDGGR